MRKIIYAGIFTVLRWKHVHDTPQETKKEKQVSNGSTVNLFSTLEPHKWQIDARAF